MEAHELKIGSTYLSVKFNVPVKCWLSDFAQLDFLCQGAELDSDIISQVFEPIELTEEWFKKSQFIKDDYSKYGGWLSPEFNKSRIRITIRNNAFIYKLNENNFIELKYVHKLQNLVYELTGGNELEIK